MRLAESLADRMLAIVAPRVTARAACCGETHYTVSCSCTGGYLYEKTCYTNCCSTSCTPCFKTATKC